MFMPAMVRTAAERACRNVILRARLPKRFGSRRIYLSPASQLSVLKRGDAKFESYLLGFVDRFISPEDVVWDIGANMGVFTFPAAHAGAKVIAFEPDHFTRALMERTLEANPDLDVTIVSAAISDRDGFTDLVIPARGRSTCFIAGARAGSDTGGVRHTRTVLAITLDRALQNYPAPDFIKCDAEGAEAMILRGASSTLRNARPCIQFELAGGNGPECRAILEREGYKLFDALEPLAAPAKGFPYEVLAIPAEKVGRYINH